MTWKVGDTGRGSPGACPPVRVDREPPAELMASLAWLLQFMLTSLVFAWPLAIWKATELVVAGVTWLLS